MNTPANEQLQAAKAAYTRYGVVTDHKNFRGDPMPEFEQLPDKIKEAWVAAVWPLEESQDHTIGEFLDILGELIVRKPGQPSAREWENSGL